VRLRLARAEGASERLERVDGVHGVVPDEDAAAHGLRITVVDGPKRLVDLIEAARPFGVLEVAMQRPTLEHVFLHHTGHSFEAPLEGGS
jgi:hypothetical protein